MDVVEKKTGNLEVLNECLTLMFKDHILKVKAKNARDEERLRLLQRQVERQEGKYLMDFYGNQC